MGRKAKSGIDYFNVDVKFIDDYKIDKLNSITGAKGIAILHYLYACIHYQGYYLEFEDKHYLVRLIKKAFCYDQLDGDQVTIIMDALLTSNLFNRELFDKGILTSKEIQEHHYEVTRKRKHRVFSLYWLLSEMEMEELDRKSNIRKNASDFISSIKNDIYDSENEVFDDKSTQSKSKSKRKRDKEDKYDKSILNEFSLLHYLTKLLIRHDYIDDFDLDIMKYNDLFKELVDDYGFDKVCSCCNYIVRYSKRTSTEIDDKFNFFKTSINNNLERIESREKNSNKTIEDWFIELIKLNKN